MTLFTALPRKTSVQFITYVCFNALSGDLKLILVLFRLNCFLHDCLLDSNPFLDWIFLYMIVYWIFFSSDLIFFYSIVTWMLKAERRLVEHVLWFGDKQDVTAPSVTSTELYRMSRESLVNNLFLSIWRKTCFQLVLISFFYSK
jgi:hypothetical protein